jgi:DNA-binding CsgD family transcriptional regulator
VDVVLYERDQALRAIGEALDAARLGHGGSILVIGEAGTGKTTLLDAAARMATQSPARVLVVRANGAAMEADLPFAFAEQLVGPILAWAGSPNDNPKTRRALVYDSARVQLDRLAETSPVVAILDDLHWADPDSLDLVGFLARRLARLPVAFVGAMRSWPEQAASLARSLALEGHAQVVETRPLSEAASAALLVELVDTATGPAPKLGAPGLDAGLIDRAWRLTRGNPMLVGQVARSIAQTGDLPETAGADLARLQRTLVLSHLAGLDPVAIDCARAAAVLRTRIRMGVLEKVTGLDEQAFVQAFDALVGAGVLRYEAGIAEFSHDLLASAIYQDTLPAKRQGLHAAAFSYYAEHHDFGAAAPHALAADLRGDQAVLEVLVSSGVAALGGGALQTGLGQLRAAVGQATDSATPELMIRLADAFFGADCADEALAVCKEISRRPLAPEVRVQVLRRAARAQALSGDLAQSMGIYQEALAELAKLSSPEQVLSGLLADRAHVAWEGQGPSAALEVLDPASSPTWPDPEPASIAALRAYMRLTLGDPSGLELIVHAAGAARHGLGLDPEELSRPLNLYLIHPGALAFVERYDEAHALIADARQRYSAGGSVRSGVAVATLRASMLLNQGFPEMVVAEGQEVDGTDLLGRPRLSLMQAEALTWLGRIDESVEVCDRLEATDSVRSQFARFNLGLARAQHLAAKGAPLEAAARYLSLEDTARRVGVASMATARWFAGAIEAALSVGRWADATRLADWLEEADTSLGCTWPRMLALGARAGVAASGAAAGDGGAEALYLAALEACTTLPLARAAIQLRYGRWMFGRGRIAPARAALAGCVALAEERGAALLGTQARAELSRAGGRRRRASSPSSLTAQESKVARMAASGAAIKEIAAVMYLSRRTVESHLAHVYTKLGVHSKSELRHRRVELGL